MQIYVVTLIKIYWPKVRMDWQKRESAGLDLHDRIAVQWTLRLSASPFLPICLVQYASFKDNIPPEAYNLLELRTGAVGSVWAL